MSLFFMSMSDIKLNYTKKHKREKKVLCIYSGKQFLLRVHIGLFDFFEETCSFLYRSF